MVGLHLIRGAKKGKSIALPFFRYFYNLLPLLPYATSLEKRSSA